MTGLGAWTLGLAVLHTVVLVAVPALAGTRTGARDFFVGGRSFSPATVAFCITGLFSGSSFIAILELSYRTGISAVWYGVAEITQIMLIATLLVKPLRERLVVTISGLVGDRFGRLARGIAGAITAFTFPMWSVATAIAFASALHVVTGLSVHLAVVVTALLLLAFLSFGGMRSVAFAQTANSAVFLVMLIVGGAAVLANPGVQGIAAATSTRPELFDLGGAGTGLIVAWFGTFVVNVILAQAAFQMSLSCRTPEDGQNGLHWAALLAVPFIVIGTLLGVAAALVVPGEALGLVGVATYVSQVLPAPLAAVFFLGLWACALGWGGPCQFSGATSLGRDVGLAIRPDASPEQLVRWTRWALVLLTALMVGFAFLRTEQSAWWNVLAWTLRNGATLAPVVAVLFWPVARPSGAIISMIAGFGAGLGWYHLSQWQPNEFFAGIHPVWVGMGVNLAVLVVATLAGGQWSLTPVSRDRRRAGEAAVAAVVLASGTAFAWNTLHPLGLTGLALFLVVVAGTAAVILGTEKPGERAAENSDELVQVS